MSENGPTEWEQVKAALAKASPYLDANATPTKWAPSDLIRIGYHMLATGPKPAAAVEYVNDMLDEACNRYAAGFYADPFCEPCVPRAAPSPGFAGGR